jgi:hypothetical protein
MRPMHAHVGCSKTGTSSLQVGLWASAARLGSADVGLPFVGRRAHRQRLLDPFGWQPAKGFVGDWDDPALEETGRRLAKAHGHRVLVSDEDLVELPPRGVDRFLELATAAGLELHVVVTLRDWVGEALGLDPSLIAWPDRAVNTSHGGVEAEVFRRVDAVLPAAFDDYSELAWVQQRSREAVVEVRTSGCKVLARRHGRKACA